MRYAPSSKRELIILGMFIGVVILFSWAAISFLADFPPFGGTDGSFRLVEIEGPISVGALLMALLVAHRNSRGSRNQ